MPWRPCLHAGISQTHYATEIIIKDLCFSDFAVVLIFHHNVAHCEIWVAKLSLQVAWAELYGTAVVDRREIFYLTVDPRICASCVEDTVDGLLFNIDGAYVRIRHLP